MSGAAPLHRATLPMPPRTSPQPSATPPTRGVGLWLFIVLAVVVGIVLGFRHGPGVASLLGTRG